MVRTRGQTLGDKEEEVNGDARVILNRLIAIETKQEERHRENKIDIKVLFKKMEKLDNLPCNVHIERMAWFNRYLIGISIVICGIIGWIAKTHLGG